MRVVDMTRLAGAVLTLALSAAPAVATVDAGDYRAFWLWGGVVPPLVLANAATVYVLQGQVGSRHDGGVVMTAQGISVPRLRQGEVWLVYRAETLRWPPAVYATLLRQLARWREAGNPVVGVQIDFDARTSYLDEYVGFLRDLRRRLPADCRLGITGLLDWSSNADPDVINELKGTVDEVVVQTYQGRRTITDYERYLPRVGRLTLPFKIGLIERGEWNAPSYLATSPWFRGYVVFLRNP